MATDRYRNECIYIYIYKCGKCGSAHTSPDILISKSWPKETGLKRRKDCTMGTCWPDRFPQGSSAVRVLRGWFLLMLLLPLLLFSLYIAVAFCTRQNLSTSNALQVPQTRRIRNTVSKLPSGWVAMFSRPRSLSLPPCVVGFAPSSESLEYFYSLLFLSLHIETPLGDSQNAPGLEPSVHWIIYIYIDVYALHCYSRRAKTSQQNILQHVQRVA